MEFIALSEQAFNTIHANDVSFFDELDAVIQREPLGVIDDEIRGLLSSIGIRKGTPFAPDDRMRALLTEAVAVANGTARAIAFKTRDPEAYKYQKVSGRPRSSATTTAGWSTTASVDATSTPGPCSSISRPSTRPRWRCTSRSGFAMREHRARQHGRVPRRRPGLRPHPPTRSPGQRLLVDRRLRPPDPIGTPDRATVPEQEQHARPARCQH